jgi:hypothetical protein
MLVVSRWILPGRIALADGDYWFRVEQKRCTKLLLEPCVGCQQAIHTV